jgi:hypothetical protein
MTNTTALIKSVNESHWAEDYNDAALPDDRFLRRRLGRRAREAGLDISDLVMGEFGPAGAYAYKIHNEQQ